MTETTQRSAVRRRRVPLIAAIAAAAGLALGGSATASPLSASSGDGPYGGGSGGGASRTGYFSQGSVVSLDLETTNLSVPAGEFTAPVTGTCLIDGAADFRWDANNGHSRIGYTYGGLQFSGEGVGEVHNTGSDIPLYNDVPPPAGTTLQGTWPLSATVEVTEGQTVTVSLDGPFDSGGLVGDVTFVTDLAYSCP